MNKFIIMQQVEQNLTILYIITAFFDTHNYRTQNNIYKLVVYCIYIRQHNISTSTHVRFKPFSSLPHILLPSTEPTIIIPKIKNVFLNNIK